MITPARFFLLVASLSTAAVAGEKVDFNYDIQPMISTKCFHCHGPDEKAREAKLRLDLRDEALRERDGVRAIVPGDLTASELVARIVSKDKDEVMPPPKEGHPLTAREIDLFKRWIAEGAEYQAHWSFVKPARPAAVAGGSPIDAMISARLGRAGLAMSQEADQHSLLRRVTLDLTGLPPTLEELSAFTSDAATDAYAKVIDRLLASPAYGERWAKMWLDLARYADSTGYGSDAFRMNIWPYRDWVIDAFNRNLPYDQFTIEQLAGDLLPGATPEQIAATAFHRNTMTNTEGGTDDEEFRVVAVKDRVATTGQVWMGLTVGCAQCHTHKFDPISHQEYYQLFAIFNQTEDADRNDDAPKMPIVTAQEKAARERLGADIAALEAKVQAGSPEFDAEQHEWEAKANRPTTWTALPPVAFAAKGGTQLTAGPGATVAAHGPSPEEEKYTLQVAGAAPGITAFRLEVLPDPAGKGAVVTDFSAAVRSRDAKTPVGRFVRITQPGELQFLMLAEAEVFSAGANVARVGKASQSSTDFGGDAARAIDGKTDGHFFSGMSVTHTGKDKDAWWEVDLGMEKPIEEVAIWARTDAHVGLMKGFRVELLDATRRAVWQQSVAEAPLPTVKLAPTGERRIALREASANASAPGSSPSHAIDADAKKTGWAVETPTDQPHAIVFQAAEPVSVSPDSVLVFELRQYAGAGRTLRHFRLSATSEPLPIRELPASIRATLALEPSEREPASRAELAAYFRPLSKHAAGLLSAVEAKKAELAKIKPVELPIMRERAADQRRATHIFNKGNFNTPGEAVTAALPVAFHPAPAAPRIDRLALARWVVSRDNPLTARVAVNRFWAQLFGTGIVESEEDFGTQGTLPSHPELLDWLAVEFMESGWDVKALLKTIVKSAAYRQSAKTTPDHLQKDAPNRLLARHPRRRLDAEGVRDQALALAGLLSPKLGGPSVYPPQPDGLWNVAFNGGQNAYPTSTGEDRYRRGLYTFWRRTMPNPTMTTFDAPSRETCSLRRVPTNTPLQAFVALNDPVFVECAQALGRRILREGGPDTASRLRFALQLCLARPAEQQQVAALQQLFDAELAGFRADAESAKKLATQPLGELPAGVDPAEAAAWMVIANVLLNLDGVLTKG